VIPLAAVAVFALNSGQAGAVAAHVIADLGAKLVAPAVLKPVKPFFYGRKLKFFNSLQTSESYSY
jgi:hypothetical protein